MITGKYGNATAAEISQMLGLKGTSQFPDAGMSPRPLQGHLVWVTAKVPGRMRIRVMTRCLTCDKVIQVGRLAQHERAVHDGQPHGRY